MPRRAAGSEKWQTVDPVSTERTQPEKTSCGSAPVGRPPRGEIALAAALCAALSCGLQASFDRVIGSDGFFHIAQAARVWGGGMPWMPNSVFADGWVDHQLGFHLLLWPLTLVLPPIAAAKAGAALLGAAALFAIWLFARRAAMPVPWAVALLPIGLGWLFWLRLEMPRTQSLSLVLLIACLAALREDRPRQVAAVAAAFAWTYHVALIVLPVSAGWAAVQGLRERSLRPLRLPAAAALGLALGWTIHPHFPRTWRFLHQHVVLKVLNEDALPVGLEWTDGGTDALLRHGWGALLALAVAAAGLAMSKRRRTDAIALFGLGVASTAAVLVGTKFVEYALPLSFLAAGAAARDAWPVPPRAARRVLLAICAAAVLASGAAVRRAVLHTEPPPDRLVPALQAVRDVAAPGDVVFHFSWNDFPELALWGPEFRYVVGLDPHFLALHDPELWALYEAIGGPFDGRRSRFIADRFHARWALLVLPYPGGEEALSHDPGMERIWGDEHAVLYEVAPER